jgi:ribonucleotide reductase alpha subunit
MYVKSNFSGEFTIINRFLVTDLKELGLWDEDMMEKVKYYDGSVQKIDEIPAEVRARYKEVFEIDSAWIVKHASHRGKWIDQSQSVNVFTTSTSGKQISDIYMLAWKMGLKTTYYLRTLGASGIEKSTLDSKAKKFGRRRVTPEPRCRRAGQTPARSRPDLRACPVREAQTGNARPAAKSTPGARARINKICP